MSWSRSSARRDRAAGAGAAELGVRLPGAEPSAAGARRLRAELDLDWPGIAMALTLLDRVDTLQQENRQLRRQLARFLQTS